MRRFFTLLLTLPFLLLVACSDDEPDNTDLAAPPAATATVTANETTTAESPTPAAVVEGTVSVDFTGAPEELEAIEAPFEVEAGSTAWEAVQVALGEDNVSYQDFGGDLGIFVSGFNGVDAQGNNFWEFRINGESASKGVGSYEVQPGDVLEFVYSSF